MKLLLILCMTTILFLPQAIFAQEGLVTCEGPDCNLCSVVTMANGLIDWLFGIAVLIAVILIVYAGFLLVFSRGDVSAASKGKQILTNAVIGIIIMLAAWTIVDTFMKAFLGGDFGVWNEVQQCGGSYKVGETKKGIDLQAETVTVIPPSGGANSLEGPESILDSSGGEITSSVSTNNGRVSFAYSSSLATAQQGHLSATLAAFQRCVANKADPALYIITSVSDNKIANGSKTWEYCAVNGKSGGCAHTARSCHYGGASCVGSSYALDIRTSNIDSAQERSILNAATACGGWGQNEGNHLHISKGDACGCR